jgi:hypothetical protein
MKDAEKGFPHEGAKEHYILDMDNSELSREVTALLEPVVPIPKPKKKINEIYILLSTGVGDLRYRGTLIAVKYMEKSEKLLGLEKIK